MEGINLDEEFSQLKQMLQAETIPSGDCIKQLVAVCYQKGQLKQHLNGIVVSLVDICKLTEERVEETPEEVKEVMLILDSIT